MDALGDDLGLQADAADLIPSCVVKIDAFWKARRRPRATTELAVTEASGLILAFATGKAAPETFMSLTGAADQERITR